LPICRLLPFGNVAGNLMPVLCPWRLKWGHGGEISIRLPSLRLRTFRRVDALPSPDSFKNGRFLVISLGRINMLRA
jgi:hypothetical protein